MIQLLTQLDDRTLTISYTQMWLRGLNGSYFLMQLNSGIPKVSLPCLFQKFHLPTVALFSYWYLLWIHCQLCFCLLVRHYFSVALCLKKKLYCYSSVEWALGSWHSCQIESWPWRCFRNLPHSHSDNDHSYDFV